MRAVGGKVVGVVEADAMLEVPFLDNNIVFVIGSRLFFAMHAKQWRRLRDTVERMRRRRRFLLLQVYA